MTFTNRYASMCDATLEAERERVDAQWNKAANEGLTWLAKALSKEAGELDAEWFRRYPAIGTLYQDALTDAYQDLYNVEGA